MAGTIRQIPGTNVFFGSYYDPRLPEKLKELGIRKVFVTEEIPTKGFKEAGITVSGVGLWATEKDITQFLNNAPNPKEKFLIACCHGKNRSAMYAFHYLVAARPDLGVLEIYNKFTESSALSLHPARLAKLLNSRSELMQALPFKTKEEKKPAFKPLNPNHKGIFTARPFESLGAKRKLR